MTEYTNLDDLRKEERRVNFIKEIVEDRGKQLLNRRSELHEAVSEEELNGDVLPLSTYILETPELFESTGAVLPRAL